MGMRGACLHLQPICLQMLTLRNSVTLRDFFFTNYGEINGVTSAGGGSVILEYFTYEVRFSVHVGIQR